MRASMQHAEEIGSVGEKRNNGQRGEKYQQDFKWKKRQKEKRK